MGDHGVLIVGGSHAGLSIAATLRALGYTAPVTMASADSLPPYDRPPLSKSYLLGQATEEDLQLRTRDFYDSQDIEVVTSERISGLDLVGRTAASAGREFRFDRLALATGADARRLEIPGSALEGLCYLRYATDAVALGSRLPEAEQVVVVGGGFIGLEAAAVVRSLGKDATVVEVAPSLIARSARPILAEYIQRLHTSHGVQLELGAGVAAFEGANGRVEGVTLADGRTLRADLVVVGVGIVRRVELARAAGLEVDDGVVVDDHAVTSDPEVVAAGDVTVIKDPSRPHVSARHESIHNAISQGAAAARSIMGLAPAAPEAPWFWSDQFDTKVQMVGKVGDPRTVVTRGDMASETFSVLYFDGGGQMTGADCVNRPKDFLVARRALDKGMQVDMGIAQNADRPLREALT